MEPIVCEESSKIILKLFQNKIHTQYALQNS